MAWEKHRSIYDSKDHAGGRLDLFIDRAGGAGMLQVREGPKAAGTEAAVSYDALTLLLVAKSIELLAMDLLNNAKE